jgi:RNA polymerase sigma-70 factor (ECF subfamily)
VTEQAARRAAEAAARESYGRLVAYLARRCGDLATAEDALAEAFAAALERWPRQGCPRNPAAWLLTAARRRLVDGVRRHRVRAEAAERLRLVADELAEAEPAEFPDERLQLMLACAHPAIESSVHAPLMLQAVIGLDADDIASAFLVSPAAMRQRLVRAKARLRETGEAFVLPSREALDDRLEPVLAAVYATYTHGWSDPGGADPARRELAAEALFLARLLAALAPEEPEALGLAALLLHAEARRPARRAPDGEYLPLDDQDPTLWDGPMIDAAESLLRAAAAHGRAGRYQLEAALQSAHVHRRRSGQENWSDVVTLYDGLLSLTDSPVVAVNRALAIARAEGPGAGLVALPAAPAAASLESYQPYWAARAELLARAGAPAADARSAYEVAIGLERDPAVARFLQQRLARLDDLD